MDMTAAAADINRRCETLLHYPGAAIAKTAAMKGRACTKAATAKYRSRGPEAAAATVKRRRSAAAKTTTAMETSAAAKASAPTTMAAATVSHLGGQCLMRLPGGWCGGGITQ